MPQQHHKPHGLQNKDMVRPAVHKQASRVTLASNTNTTPPSMNASRRHLGLSGLPATKVSYECWIQDVPGWDPAPLLRAVALPVYEVLEPSAPTSDVKKLAHRVCFRAVDKSWGWGGFGGSVQGTGHERLDLGDVEGGVNTAKGRGELETDSSGAKDFSNGEGPNETGG